MVTVVSSDAYAVISEISTFPTSVRDVSTDNAMVCGALLSCATLLSVSLSAVRCTPQEPSPVDSADYPRNAQAEGVAPAATTVVDVHGVRLGIAAVATPSHVSATRANLGDSYTPTPSVHLLR